MQNKNILALLESYVDKVILAVSVLVSLFLVWSFVISNPHGENVRFRGGREKKLGPSEIDRETKRVLEESLPELDRPAAPMPYDKAYLSEYNRLLELPLSEIPHGTGSNGFGPSGFQLP